MRSNRALSSSSLATLCIAPQRRAQGFRLRHPRPRLRCTSSDPWPLGVRWEEKIIHKRKKHSSRFDAVPDFLPSSMVSNPPDLYINFETNQAWSKLRGVTTATSLVSVSRASAATQVDSSGVWSQFASNTLARSDLGASIWEARTNSIRNNTMQGAVAGSPGTLPTNWSLGAVGGISTNVIGTGTQNGINYIDIQITGTPSGIGSPHTINFEAPTQIAALYGQTWSSTTFIALVGGDLTNISTIGLYIRERDSGGSSLVGNSNTVIPNSTLTRYTYSVTLSNKSTAFAQPQLGFVFTNTITAVNATFRIGWPQLENNSLINSTVASAVKAADGTGGVNGSGVYSVGGGTGTAATLNVTWAAGVMTVNSVASAGSYTVFPPSPATLTYVSGAATGWTGATVTLTPTNNAAQGVASNPILTTNAAATKNSDVVQLTTNPTSPAIGSIWVKYVAAPSGLTFRVAVQLDSGASAANAILLDQTSGTNIRTESYSGGSGTNRASATISANVSNKVMTAWQDSDWATVANGGAVGTNAVAGMPTIATPTYRLGAGGSISNFINSNVKEVAFWFTQRVPNAQLQSTTT